MSQRTICFFVKLLILAGIVLGFVGMPSAHAAEEKPAVSEGPKAERPKTKLERYDIYIHKWLKMPEISGRAVGATASDFNFKSKYGRATVVVFLATSCEPCQEQMDMIRRLEDKYKKLFTDFVYVFVSDLNKDALDFAKEFKLTDSMLVLAGPELLKEFKNPELPTIYIGDRYGWIGTSFSPVSVNDLAQVEQYLKLTTAF